MKIGKIMTILLAALLFVCMGAAGAANADSGGFHRLGTLDEELAVQLVDWEFIWEAPAAGIPKGEAARYTPPSGDWRKAEHLMNLGGRGDSEILWLRTMLPPTLVPKAHMLLQGSQLYEVYIGDEFLFRHGSIQPDGDSHYIGTPPRIFPIPDHAAGKPVYIRLYSSGTDIGLYDTPVVAPRAVLFMTFVENQSVRFILGCFYMMIGFLALYPYYKLKQIHLFSFAGFTSAFGAYTVIRTSLIYMLRDDPEFWMIMELITLVLAMASIIAFTEQLFGAGYLKGLNSLWKLHLLYGAVTIPLATLHFIEVPQMLKVYQLIILVSMVLVIGRVAVKAYDRDQDARVVLTGVIVFSGAGAVDIIRQMFFVESAFPELAYWGVFIFLISLVTVIIRRLLQLMVRLSNTEKLSVAGQLAAGVAHEIRNPITVIAGYLKLIQRDPANRQMIEIMQGEVNRIDLIVNEFLFLSKPSAPKYGIRRMEVIIHSVLRLFEAQAASAGVIIRLQVDENLPSVECDDNQMKQVLVNILKNGLEAMEDGGQINISVTAAGGWMSVTVKDTGCGIPAEKLARIGEPFYTTKENGNGLGVMICRSIVENHKGRYTMTSAAGVGTTVSIEIPLSRH